MKRLRAKLSHPDFLRGSCSRRAPACAARFHLGVVGQRYSRVLPGPGVSKAREGGIAPMMLRDQAWVLSPSSATPQLIPIGLIKYILCRHKAWHAYIPRPSGLQKLSATTEICFNCKMVITFPLYSKILLLSLPLPLAVSSLCGCTGPFGLGQRFILVPACTRCCS